MVSLAEDFGLEEAKREAQFDLPVRLTPLPLLRCAKSRGEFAVGGREGCFLFQMHPAFIGWVCAELFQAFDIIGLNFALVCGDLANGVKIR